MKKICMILAAVLLLAAGTAAFAGCGGNVQRDEDGNVVVTMTLMDNEYETDGWLALIDAANGVLERDGESVRIEPELVVTSSWDEYYTKVSANIFGRTGGTIGRIAESHAPTLIDRGQAADLTDLRDELVATGEYTASAFEGVAEEGGKYYGLPSGAQTMVLYYNKTLIDEYNATASDADKIEYPSGDWSNASTFEEIRDAAKKLTSGTGASKRFGISAGPYLSYIGMYSVNSGGYNIFDDEGNCVIDSQPCIDAYEWLRQMLVVDGSMPLTSDTALADPLSRFVQGNIALFIDGIWQMHYICSYSEDYEIGVAAIPVLDSSYASSTTTFEDRFWASSTSATPEEDKIALRALMSKEATEAAARMQVGGIPVRSDCVDTYLSSLEETKLADYTEVIANSIANRISVPYSVYYNQADQMINQRLSRWINNEISTAELVEYAQDVMERAMRGEL